MSPDGTTKAEAASRQIREPHHVVGGEAMTASGGGELPVVNPATGETLSTLGLADEAVVDDAVAAARDAFPEWSRLASNKRARLLTGLAGLLRERSQELAHLITIDNGKTLKDAGAEIERAIEHLEAAATAPALLPGYGDKNVATGIDVEVIREPLGVSAVVSPFNFPIMTGLIYHAWALACGNTVVLKPSEQAPLAPTALAGLLEEAGFPRGVFNVVHGGRQAVERLCDHPDVASVSLVGSTGAAKAVYARAAASGKRVHTAGGARNFIVVLPDADLEAAAGASAGSAFGMAGQRCLASSVLVPVGGCEDELLEGIVEKAKGLVVGSGLEEGTDVPPLISHDSLMRLNQVVEEATSAGGRLLLDGRRPDAGPGFYAGPAVIADVAPDGPTVSSEAFGPLLSSLPAGDLSEAIELCNSNPFGNAATIFTSSGKAARDFAVSADVGNIGVNIGVVAPPASFTFGGRKGSFFGTAHSQGREAVAFYTDPKSITARWP